MTFAGAKFLFIALSFVIGFTIASVFFLITYNLFVNPESSSSTGWTIGLLVGSILIAIITVGLTYKFTYNLAVPIIAGIAGAFGFFMIFTVTGLGGKLNGGKVWVEIAFAVVGAIIGIIVGWKLQFVVKTVGTAIIGSFIFVVGVSFYAGGLNTHNGMKQSPWVWGYIGGFIVLAVIGSVVQWKLFRNVEEDAFKDEDEAKCCGCF